MSQNTWTKIFFNKYLTTLIYILFTKNNQCYDYINFPLTYRVILDFCCVFLLFGLHQVSSEPITKLLGKFFVVENFRRISWFRIKSGSVSLSRFDLWLIVVDPSERRTARRCHLHTRPPPPECLVHLQAK